MDQTVIAHIAEAFFGMVALDFIWARYTIALTEYRSLAASMWASGIALCNGVVVLSFVHQPTMLIPVCAGAFVGTYLANRTWR